MEQQEDWSKQMSRRVGAAVRALRDSGDKKRSAQELAEETAALGLPISRARIADLEGRNRGGDIRVAELVVLARALGVPPLQLLYPGVPGEVIDVLPDVGAVPTSTTSIAAAQWFAGEEPLQLLLPTPDGDRSLTYWGDDLLQHEVGGRPLNLARKERRLFADLDRERVRRMNDPARSTEIDERIARIERDIREVRSDQRQMGLPPAPLDNAAKHIDPEPRASGPKP